MPLVAYNALVARPPFSGVEQCVVALARALAVRRAFDYFVLEAPGWCRGRVLRILYEMTLVPGVLRRSGAALLHAPAYVAPPRLPCPMVLSVYDLHVYTHPQFCRASNVCHYRARLPGALRRAGAVIVPSRHTRDALLRRFPTAAAKARVIPLGVDARFFVAPEAADGTGARQRHALPRRYLLFVGDLAPRKNFGNMLRAWELLRRGDPELGLVLVGAPAGADVRPAPGLCLPGYVADADLPAIYAQARALLYPSWDEGFGLPVLEALAAGCPAVCSGGAPAEFAEGVAAFCDPADPDDITRQAAPWLADSPARAARIAAGRARAADYTWDRVAAATEAVYREVLSSRSA
ncbi:MAG: glycosyltransferase family 1 protein [Kiritimatiellae bacterium]|nr:glycosyltransferase family 1 protein [Kiritimatiellia bacterium]